MGGWMHSYIHKVTFVSLFAHYASSGDSSNPLKIMKWSLFFCMTYHKRFQGAYIQSNTFTLTALYRFFPLWMFIESRKWTFWIDANLYCLHLYRLSPECVFNCNIYFYAPICQIWLIMPNMHIWVCQIWSSGVPLKRSCRMQFRRVGLRSIGPSSQKLWPNQNFGWTCGIKKYQNSDFCFFGTP